MLWSTDALTDILSSLYQAYTLCAGLYWSLNFSNALAKTFASIAAKSIIKELVHRITINFK